MKHIDTYSTGWFGRATEKGHSAKSTMVHVLKNGKSLCGYIPHSTMQFQLCSQTITFDYIECPKCKKMSRDILIKKHENAISYIKEKK